MKIKIGLPRFVTDVIGVLEMNNLEAFAVGGCVRDCLMGRVPDDWDITTNATCDVVSQMFARVIATGVKYGTVTVLNPLCDEGIKSVEVTTYRTDGEYSDGRHPDKVEFSAKIEDDLSRRDFTINAMAYNEKRGLLDIFGGMEDIKTRTIRAVGDPEERFRQDALRIMRGIRFSAQLDFEIEENTMEAIRRTAHMLTKISAERVQAELSKLLVSENPQKICLLEQAGINRIIFPELHGKPGENAKFRTSPKLYLRLAEMFLKFYKAPLNEARDILNRLKYDNNTKSKVLRLMEHFDYEILPDEVSVKYALMHIGEDIFLDLIELRDIRSIMSIYGKIKRENQAFTIDGLEVNGSDLAELGYCGKEIGDILKKLLDYVVKNPDKNKKNILLAWVKKCAFSKY